MADAPDEVNVSRAEEYFSDTSAMLATVLSAARLDAVPPQFPPGSAISALACLDVLERGLHLLLAGDEHWTGGESDTHPALRDRGDALIMLSRKIFQIEYKDNGLFGLSFDPKPRPNR